MDRDFSKNQTNKITGKNTQTSKFIRLPDEIKIYPTMGLRAMLTRAGGAWRIWAIARSVDMHGAGRIFEKEFRLACKNAGLQPKTYDRWVNQAITLGLFVLKTRTKNNEKVILITDLTKTAIALECQRIEKFAVFMDSEILINGDWRGKCWEAYIQINHNHNIISREKLAEITGVERHQQVRLEKGTNVKNKVNVVITEFSSDHVIGFRENGRETAYTYKGKMAFRIPDQRGVTSEQKLAKEGRSKKVNACLKSHFGMSSKTGEALSSPNEPIKRRIFFPNYEKYHRTLKYRQKHGINVEDMFILQTNPSNRHSAGVWDNLPVRKDVQL